MAGGSRKRQRLEVDARRAQLLEIGQRVFGERPYDEISIDDLAHEAGISKGLLYHYFPTKRDYYVAALREAAVKLVAETEPPETLPPVERVKVGVERYLAFVASHARSYKALLAGGIGSDPEVAAVVEQTRQTIVGRILEGVLLGGRAKAPALLTILVRSWIGTVEAASIAWLDQPSVPAAEIRDLVVAALVDALARYAPKAPLLK